MKTVLKIVSLAALLVILAPQIISASANSDPLAVTYLETITYPESELTNLEAKQYPMTALKQYVQRWRYGDAGKLLKQVEHIFYTLGNIPGQRNWYQAFRTKICTRVEDDPNQAQYNDRINLLLDLEKKLVERRRNFSDWEWSVHAGAYADAIESLQACRNRLMGSPYGDNLYRKSHDLNNW